MKRLRNLHRFASTFAVAAILASASFSQLAHAQSSETQDKIRLMATALRAREAGDLAVAKENLEELLRVNPDDQNVQRLLDSVNKDIERLNAGQPTVYGQAAQVTTFEPSGATVTDSTTVVSMSNADGTDTTAEVVLTGGNDVDYLLAAASSEQQKAIAQAEQAMADAELLIENGRANEADVILEAAQMQIPDSTATEMILADVRNMRGDIILDAGEKALDQNNATAARAAVQAYRDTLGDDKRLAKFEGEVKELEMNPWRQEPDKLSPEYVSMVDKTDELLVTARAMMLYGDFSGSQAKLREVEARDPTNPAAKALQMEIMQQLKKSAWLDHAKTRDQMLEEVSRGWQRPQVYDIGGVIDDDPTINPVMVKLQSIYIPRVGFSGVPLSRVIETLSEMSVEYDPDVEAKDRGVNIVLIDNSGASAADPLVSITLRSLSLDRILDFTTESVGYTWDISDETIIVSRGNQGDGIRLETEFFPISSTVMIRLTGGSGGGGGGVATSADPFAAPSAPVGPSGGGNDEEALKDFFQRAGVDFNEPGSSLAFDGTQLIVTQTPKNLEKLRNILRRYDQTKQVEIEAKFVDVIQGNLDELGFNWSVSSASGRNSFSTSNQNLNQIFSTNTQNSDISIDTTLQDPVTGVISTITNSVPSGSPIIPNAIDLGALGGVAGSFMGVIQGVDVNLMVNALSRQEGSDLLSSPKLTVMSGETAEIVVAQELRYPENYGDIEAEVSQAGSSSLSVGGSSAAVAITAGTPQDFITRNVGVEMEVTPTVEENDNISLRLKPRVTEFEGFVEYGGPSVAIAGGTTVTVPSGFYQPIFSTRFVRTHVTVFDGATVVIGGLTREEIKTIDDKVPLLGDIPFLGRLFQNKGESAQKRNLLIFVTANLISPGGSPARQSIGTVKANSLFQSPVVVTPGGGVSREISE